MDSSLPNISSRIILVGEIGKTETEWLENLLDHAWFDKTDVSYDQTKKELVVKLKRHEGGSKAKKKFLGIGFWDNSIHPAKNSILIIRDIEGCNVRDEDPKNPLRKEVISGGIVFYDNEVYLGSFCEHENPYGITMKVKKINITLGDI